MLPTNQPLLEKSEGKKDIIRDQYHVHESIILTKIFQIPPWKKTSFGFDGKREILFPIKLCSHLFLLVILCCLVLLDNYQWGEYKRSASIISCGFFLPSDQCNYQECMGYLSSRVLSLDHYQCDIYKKPNLKSAILNSINTYYQINSSSITQFQYPDAINTPLSCRPNNQISVPKINLKCDATSYCSDYYLTNNSQLTELYLDNLLRYNLSSLHAIELVFPLADQFITDVYQAIYIWEYKIIFDFSTQVKFIVHAKSDITQICNIQSTNHLVAPSQMTPEGSHSQYSYQTSIYALSICCIVVSIVYLCILLHETIQNFRLFFYVNDYLFMISKSLLSISDSHTNPPKQTNSCVQTVYSFCCHYILKPCEVVIRYMLAIPLQFPFEPIKQDILAPEELYSLGNKKKYDSSAVQKQPSSSSFSTSLNNSSMTEPKLTQQEKNQQNLEEILNNERRKIKMWKQLSAKVKMRLLDGWRIIGVFASIMSLYASIVFINIKEGYYAMYFPGLIDDAQRLFLGLSTALMWVSLLSYLRYSNRFTSSALILWGAFFKVQRILISALPIAMGLMLCGILIFGETIDNFGSIKSIFITIFSVMNCDSIWDTYNQTTVADSTMFLGTIYVTLIFVIFSYVMLRLFLAVIESLYFYLQLYTQARKKRIVFRRKLVNAKDEFLHQPMPVRVHTSQEIQESLFYLYIQSTSEKTKKQD